MRALRERARVSGDRGAASVFVIGLIFALMVLAGLVVDGGRAVNGRAAALDDAEQAARAGANEIDEGLLRSTGQVRIDTADAERSARAFVVARGYAADDVHVTANDRTVTVRVQDEVPTALLSLIGVNSFNVTGTATARAAVGIVNEIGGAP
ncbi:pilus assembly protein TadG-related protein [Cellulomonas sp. HZM]|uniref:pilus assembly protein TadG-related protein n=1 Tax=Cellulomonas sp. HZM TaxID=1454010 RepID=UPI000493635F|nr:pilus assembly protein TadG-related protein [Cellulomonas sp. HZM]